MVDILFLLTSRQFLFARFLAFILILIIYAPCFFKLSSHVGKDPIYRVHPIQVNNHLYTVPQTLTDIFFQPEDRYYTMPFTWCTVALQYPYIFGIMSRLHFIVKLWYPLQRKSKGNINDFYDITQQMLYFLWHSFQQINLYRKIPHHYHLRSLVLSAAHLSFPFLCHFTLSWTVNSICACVLAGSISLKRYEIPRRISFSTVNVLMQRTTTFAKFSCDPHFPSLTRTEELPPFNSTAYGQIEIWVIFDWLVSVVLLTFQRWSEYFPWWWHKFQATCRNFPCFVGANLFAKQHGIFQAAGPGSVAQLAFKCLILTKVSPLHWHVLVVVFFCVVQIRLCFTPYLGFLRPVSHGDACQFIFKCITTSSRQ